MHQFYNVFLNIIKAEINILENLNIRYELRPNRWRVPIPISTIMSSQGPKG